MSSIDNRIVNMQFNNNEFERGISTSLQSLSKLSNSLKGLDGTDLDGVAKNIDNISGKFSALGIAGIAAITNIANRVTDLGINMAKSLSIDQITAGFDKYASTTKDIKALMNQIDGSTIEDITKNVEQLAWYSDATSYSYSAMVSALKNFASQGISMEEAIPMIMGIGNSMSYAGLAAEEASAGFDIYSKSIAQGYMPLIQWKRLQNMGGATAGLKKQFIDAAVALGTLKDMGNGAYETMSGLAVSISNFDYTLGDQDGKWLTADVIKAVMGLDYGEYAKGLYEFSQVGDNAALSVNELMDNYEDASGTIDEFGRKAFEAAQQARTFSEAVNAVKDAASTAWMNLFTNVFGNAEEATEVWGNFSDWLYNIFLPPMQRLVDITSKWKSLGGRDALLESFGNLAEGLSNLSTPISEAFRSIFKPFTEVSFVSITNGFKSFTESVKNFFADDDFSEKVGNGLFDTSSIDDAVTRADKIRTVSRGLFASLDIIRIVLGKVVEGLRKVADALRPVITRMGDLLVRLSEMIIKFRDYLLEENNFFDSLEKTATAVADFVSSFHPIRTVFEFLKDAVPFVTEKLKEFFTNIKNALGPAFSMQGGNGILAFVGAIAGLKALNWNVLDPLKAILDIPKAVGVVLDDLAGALEVFTVKIEGDALMSVAKGVALLAVSLLLLASINPENLAVGLAGLAGVMLILEQFMASIIKFGGTSFKGIIDKIGTLAVVGRAVTQIGTGILLLAVAMKVLSAIDNDAIVTSIITIGALLLEVGVFAKAATKHIPSLIGLGVGMLVLSAAMKVLASIKANDALAAVGIIALLLTEIALFSATTGAKLIATGAGLVLVSGALLLMTGALAALSAIDPMKLLTGIGELGLALTVLAIALVAMNNTLAGSAALLVAAVAIDVLAVALAALSVIPFTQLLTSIGALALALIVLSGATVLLAPMATGMLAVAGAMALFGVAMLAFGAGLTMVAASATAAAASVVGVITIILTAIPTWATALVNAISTLVVAFANAITIAIPTLMDTMMTVITAILTTIDENLPQILERGMSILMTLIDGLLIRLPELVNAAVEIVITFIENLAIALENNQERLILAIGKLLGAILVTVGNLFKTLMVDVGPKAVEVGMNLISGLLEGIGRMAKKLWDKVTEIATGVINSFKRIFDLNSPSKVTEEMGMFLDEGLANGLTRFSKVAETAAEETGDGVLDAMSSSLSDLGSIADSGISPVITPVMDLTQVQNGTRELGSLLNDPRFNSTIPGSVQSNTALIQSTVAQEVAALRKDVLSMNNPTTDIVAAFQEALSTMGVWMDSKKVGDLVSLYQANVSRMRGV